MVPSNSSLALTKNVGGHFFLLSKDKCSRSQNSCFLSSPFRCALLVSSDTRIGSPDGSARIPCRQAGWVAGYPQTQPAVAASDEDFRASKCLYISPYDICVSFILDGLAVWLASVSNPRVPLRQHDSAVRTAWVCGSWRRGTRDIIGGSTRGIIPRFSGYTQTHWCICVLINPVEINERNLVSCFPLEY